MNTIYLDHSSSAPLAEEVIEAMQPWLFSYVGNAKSNHSLGRQGQEAIESARMQVAELLGAAANEIIFTSGGTEANNLAVKGIAERAGRGHIVVSAIEHPCILQPAQFYERRGFSVTHVPVNSEAVVDPNDVKDALREDTILCCIMLANNQVGSFQPVEEISEITRERGVPLHVDAAQVAGKESVRVKQLGVNLLSISAHKFNGPQGVGALYIRDGVDLEPLLHGAGHERGLRSGTQNVMGIVGIGAAAERFSRTPNAIAVEYRTLRDFFEQSLEEQIADVKVNALDARRLVTTSSVSFLGVNSGELLEECPEIAAAAGAACQKDHTSRSHVLEAMGVSAEQQRGTIRFSIGLGTSKDQLSAAVQLLESAVSRLR